MTTDALAGQPHARAWPASRLAKLEWPASAWGAIAVTSLFVAITCWWLSQDHTIPVFDAGLHLVLAIEMHREFGAGNLGHALTHTIPYPPFAYLIACLGMLVGGVAVAPPIIAENLVFVTLLALGCYKVARLAFGPLAGLLAVVFALGSPLIIAQFHVFMTDAPETAMVAVSVWLIIATEGFSQLRRCAIAGVAVGCGMITKEPFAVFVVGIVATTLWRGGWRCWRGFALFALIALVIALPWYVKEWHQIQTIGNEASSTSSTFNQYRIPDVAPPRLSPTNLEWYLWSMINNQLYLPLFLFAAVGWLWTMVGFLRRRPVSRLAPELAIGAFFSWAIITETFIHDERYSMPLLIYLAVFGAGWIARLSARPRLVAGGALACVALANTLGTTFAWAEN
jgi:4-amino-4-deoxy-L-arabinose transferase-like glycosyltransferase